MTTRFLGLDLTADTRRSNVSFWLLAGLGLVMLASFQPQMQAFLLTEFLHEPTERHGVISGLVNFWQEIVVIVVVAIAGPLSDKFGRKSIIGAGYFLMAGAFALLPQTTSVGELLAVRCIFGVGVACVTVIVTTLLGDYLEDRSRGKASGYLGVMNGVGAMIAVFLLMRLPAMIQKGGATTAEAGTTTYLIVAAVTALFGVLMLAGLKSGRPDAAVQARQPFGALVRAGFGAMKDRRIALAYSASFISRGNLTIVGTFLALWGTNYGTTELGLSRADALAKAGMLIGIAQSMALFSAPLFGILADKMDRVRALGVALLASAIGYGSTFFVDNPFGGMMIFCTIFIGLGEVGCIITSGVLITQQAPERERGAVIGTFNMFGAIGILVANALGGWLFDHWRQSGPFVFFGLLALVVLIAAKIVHRRKA